MMAALKLEALKFQRNSFQLGPIDLTIDDGIALALVGPNGAGKSTLISSIMGLLRPQSGSIEVFGKKVDYCHSQWKADVGVVLDGQTYYERLSVSDNISFYARMRPKWDHNFADHLISQFALPKSKQTMHLSKGERQKLALIVAISHRPKLLILDEATAGVDPVIRDEMLSVMSELMRDEGMSVLMATHQMGDVAKICDKIAFIQDGFIQKMVNKDDLLDDWSRVSFRYEGDLVDFPGVIMHKSEGSMHLVTTSDIKLFKVKLETLDASHIEINRLGLDEITVDILKGLNR